MLEIVAKPVKSLKPYANNPRQNEAAVQAVMNSIREFGFKVPIIVDKSNTIVAGHTRLLAAKKLGMKEVPTIVADDLSPAQLKAFRIADNATSELATWDFELLNLEIAEMPEFDFSDFGIQLEDTPPPAVPLREIELKPYRKVHYLVSVELDKHDQVVETIASLREMDGVDVASTLN